MGDLIIRKVRFKDMNGVRNVDVLTQRMYLGKAWDTLSEEQQEQHLKTRKSEFIINCNAGYSFVAIQHGEIVGFVLAHENLPFGNEVVIRHIAVHPDYQKQGIGKRLFQALIDKTKEHKKTTIRSSINPDNNSSMQLHRSVGFRVTNWKKAILIL